MNKLLRLKTLVKKGDWLRARIRLKPRGNACSRCLSPFFTHHPRQWSARESGTGTIAAKTLFSSGKPIALQWSQSHFHDSLFTLSKLVASCEWREESS